MAMERAACTAKRHDSQRAYVFHGCRCPDAVEARRAVWRRRRRNLAGIGQRRPRGPRVGDIDPIAVERACGGEDIPLTTAELRAAIDRLDGYGLSAYQIAVRLRIAPRTVHRWRTRRRAVMAS